MDQMQRDAEENRNLETCWSNRDPSAVAIHVLTFNAWLIIMKRQLFKQLIINFERLVVASKAGSLTKLYKQTSPETMA